LLDWSTATPGLQGEPGVSDLIKTDRGTILFEVGVNLQERDPSPLLANRQKLGVSLADFDTVIISHNHMNHVGGLHYPVPRGRILTGGIDVQKVVGFGPFRGPTEPDVAENVALLARQNPQRVSLSAHDSCDYAIEQVRREFGPRYHDLRVGEWRVLAGELPVPGQAIH
jgi:hypothetical protein